MKLSCNVSILILLFTICCIPCIPAFAQDGNQPPMPPEPPGGFGQEMMPPPPDDAMNGDFPPPMDDTPQSDSQSSSQSGTSSNNQFYSPPQRNNSQNSNRQNQPPAPPQDSQRRDPSQMLDFAMARATTGLELSEEEELVIIPKIEAIVKYKMNLIQIVQPLRQDLAKLMNTEKRNESSITQQLVKIRNTSMEIKKKLDSLENNLKRVLTLQQEAQLTLRGIITNGVESGGPGGPPPPPNNNRNPGNNNL